MLASGRGERFLASGGTGSKLQAMLDTNPDGVRKLFTAGGRTTDTSITFLSSAKLTKATGAGAGYTVRVDQTALQARVTAGSSQDAALTANEVRSHVRDHLARYKVPRRVEFLKELPRNETGKILRRSLAERRAP